MEDQVFRGYNYERSGRSLYWILQRKEAENQFQTLNLILDAGCGFAKRGTIGVDLQKTPSVDIICDVHHLPFIDKVFNGCYAYALLEHVDNPQQVLKEIYRTLKPSSWLKLMVPTDSYCKTDYIPKLVNLDFKGIIKHGQALRSGEHKWQYTEKTLCSLLTENGFKITKVEYPGVPLVWGRKGHLLTRARIVQHPHLIVEATKKRD